MMTKMTKLAKTIAAITINFTVAIMSIQAVASLIVSIFAVNIDKMLPAGVYTTYLVDPSAMGSLTFLGLYLAWNILAIYGLIKLKGFIKDFEMTNILSDKNYNFLKKATVYSLILAIPQNILFNLGHVNHFIIEANLVGYLFTALVITYFIRKAKMVD